jgi:penicillin-binding protein 1A
LDSKGNVLMQAKPKLADDEANQVISTRNANTMHSMMQDVVRYGTAAKANSLKRNDLAGKTGTTNDSHDAWFAGYSSQVVGVTWVGFDQPKSLGDKETGGGVALPIWIDYMAKVLPQLPEIPRKVATESAASELPAATGFSSTALPAPSIAPVAPGLATSPPALAPPASSLPAPQIVAPRPLPAIVQ